MGSPSSCSKHLSESDFSDISKKVNAEYVKLKKTKSKDEIYLDVANRDLKGIESIYSELINAIKTQPEYNKILESKADQVRDIKAQIKSEQKQVNDLKSQLQNLKKPTEIKPKNDIESIFKSLGRSTLSPSEITDKYSSKHNITPEQANRISFVQKYWHDITTNIANENSPIEYGIGYYNEDKSDNPNGKVFVKC